MFFHCKGAFTAKSWREIQLKMEGIKLSFLLAVVSIVVNYQGQGWASKPRLDVSKTLVFGPGVHKRTSFLPLNYFFLQARNSAGEK